MLIEDSASPTDCWSELRSAVGALHRAAHCVAASPGAPGPHLTASWQAHRLTVGLLEWRRGNGACVQRAQSGLADLLSWFIGEGGGLRQEMSAPAYTDACQGLMLRVTLEEMDMDLRRTTPGEKKRASRAR